MIAIILSIILPGLGQIYYGKSLRGLLMIILTFVPFIYPIVLIWSIYDCIQLRKKVTVDPITQKQTIVAILIGFIAVPIIAFGLFTGAFYLADHISHNYTKKNKTITEMNDIQLKIEIFKDKKGYYPEKISDIIGFSPLDETLYKDAWGQLYSYKLDNSTGYILTSKGLDGLLDTKDDIILTR